MHQVPLNMDRWIWFNIQRFIPLCCGLWPVVTKGLKGYILQLHVSNSFIPKPHSYSRHRSTPLKETWVCPLEPSLICTGWIVVVARVPSTLSTNIPCFVGVTLPLWRNLRPWTLLHLCRRPTRVSPRAPPPLHPPYTVHPTHISTQVAAPIGSPSHRLTQPRPWRRTSLATPRPTRCRPPTIALCPRSHGLTTPLQWRLDTLEGPPQCTASQASTPGTTPLSSTRRDTPYQPATARPLCPWGIRSDPTSRYLWGSSRSCRPTQLGRAESAAWAVIRAGVLGGRDRRTGGNCTRDDHPRHMSTPTIHHRTCRLGRTIEMKSRCPPFKQ